MTAASASLARAFLFLNAALYLLVGVKSTLAPAKTASGLGYVTMSDRGRSEYLVFYGGLQLGLAAIFWLLARYTGPLRLSMNIAIAFYAPLVAYRILSSVRSRAVFRASAGSTALEALFLLLACLLRARVR